MEDYKEQLREKAAKLEGLLAQYGDSIEDASERNGIQVLINNAREITKGRLDASDYDVRNEAIMRYHDQLDKATGMLKRFEKPEKEKEEGRECI